MVLHAADIDDNVVNFSLTRCKAVKYDMGRYKIHFLVLLIAIASFVRTSAQRVSGSKVLLKGATIEAFNNVDDWVSNKQQMQKYPLQLLLQFRTLPNEEDKQRMAEAGVALQSYLPDRTYTAVVQNALTKDFFEIHKINFVAPVQEEWKVAKDLKAALPKGGKNIKANVSFVNGLSRQELADLLASVNATMLEDRLSALGYVKISVPSIEFYNLVNNVNVTYVGSATEDVALSQTSNSLQRVVQPSALPSLGGFGLTGQGVAIGIGDNFAGSYHIDLKDRVINYAPSPYNYHGLHISGIAGGAGIADVKGKGVATGSILSTHFFSEVLNATPSIAVSEGVSITNNSYSARAGDCAYTGTYDNLSVGVDVLSNAYPNVLHVFAAANNGRFDCTPYPTGFGTIAGGYQPAKNALVVGNIDKNYVDAESSSRGPVLDGRLKPEMVAVGAFVYSTTGTETYFFAGGTSMASPGVAGAAALLTERYKVANSNTLPRADLLKALLINGATDIGNKGPDYRFGFGYLNLVQSIKMLDSSRYFESNVGQGQEQTEVITVPANTKKLKVLLYWHDVAADPKSSKQLVNDLDLSVTSPTNTTHLPLVLDETPNSILNDAKEGEDHLNNCEQVTIDAPVAGSYTIKVKGTTLPSGSRRYVVAYNFITDNGFAYPTQGAQVTSGDSLPIYWDDYGATSTYTLEYSINAGGQWNMIDNNVPADSRYYYWGVPENISSGRCVLRLTKNNAAEVFTSETFAISPVPNAKLSDEQCPGYMQIEWEAIPNATGYEVLRKDGIAMQPVDTVTTLNYTFKGLDQSEIYYAAIRPIIDGIGGYRSWAVIHKPNVGDCNGNISDFDLSIANVSRPYTGRVGTSYELGANEAVRITIENLDNNPCAAYTVHYRLNGGAWMSQSFNDAIPANDKKTVSVGSMDLSAIGDYVIDVAIENTQNTDPVNNNDSITIFISQLLNPVLTLDVVDDFETVPSFTITKDTVGVGQNRRWDFLSLSQIGRLRSYVLDGVLIEGARSFSLDAYLNGAESANALTGTFNLSSYNANSDEVRLEFDYIVHGSPKQQAGNSVQVRGTDAQPLQNLFDFKTEEDATGRVWSTGSLSLSDAMLQSSQNFSTSTQLYFRQTDTSVIAKRNYGNGITIDNIRLYTVQNDIQLISINSPASFSCGLTGPSPLSITIRNGVSNALSNVQLNYRLDGGNVVTETLNSIDGKQTLDYTFSQNINISQSGSHTLDVWLTVAGDTYTDNDSINNYMLRNQPLISQFPYFENFENGDGYWFTGGANSSWEYGQPNAPKINKAASGNNAWVTNLTGNYNDLEHSYLYSPCFNISEMSRPALSFKLVQDIEDCGEVYCDGAYMEYTTDGSTWQRLGSHTTGDNWYTDSSYQAWALQDRTEWYTASTPLPDSISDVQFRFVFRSDPAANFEGIGVDDIRIYSDRFYLGTDDVISVSPNPTTDGRVCVEWAANSGKKMRVAMTDVAGKLVYTAEATAVQGYNKTCLQTPVFSTGVYFMRIIIGDKEHKRKVVYLRR